MEEKGSEESTRSPYLIMRANCIGEDLSSAFPNSDDPEGAWGIVCKLHESDDRATRRALRQGLFTERMGSEESVTVFINKKKAAVNRLRAAGDTINEEQLQDYILMGLSDIYTGIVTQHMFQDISLSKTEDLLKEYDQLLINQASPASQADPMDAGHSALAQLVTQIKFRHINLLCLILLTPLLPSVYFV